MHFTTERSKRREGHLPGELGVWMLILFDMSVFALLFVAFSYQRALDPQAFNASQSQLDPLIGLGNTFLLLTSSWMVVRGVARASHDRGPHSPMWFNGALVCAVAFVANKIFEYKGKLELGISPLSGDFFMYYFILTGIHLIHVMIGIALLAYFRAKAKSGFSSANDRLFLESGACYWHMVDLLWIVLFPLLYLMR